MAPAIECIDFVQRSVTEYINQKYPGHFVVNRLAADGRHIDDYLHIRSQGRCKDDEFFAILTTEYPRRVLPDQLPLFHLYTMPFKFSEDIMRYTFCMVKSIPQHTAHGDMMIPMAQWQKYNHWIYIAESTPHADGVPYTTTRNCIDFYQDDQRTLGVFMEALLPLLYMFLDMYVEQFPIETPELYDRKKENILNLLQSIHSRIDRVQPRTLHTANKEIVDALRKLEMCVWQLEKSKPP